MVDSRFSHCRAKLLPFFDGKGMVWIPLRYKGCLEPWSSSLKKRASFGWLPLLQPSFLQFTRLCQNAGLRAELNLLAVSPETLGPEASPTLYTGHLHYQKRDLAWRPEWSKSGAAKGFGLRGGRGEKNGSNNCQGFAFWHSDNRTHSGCTDVSWLAAVKILMDSYVVSTWLRLPVAYLSLLRKVLKLPAFVSENFESFRWKRRGEDGLRNCFIELHSSTATQNNFSIIDCPISYNSRFCSRNPFIWQPQDQTSCGRLFVSLKSKGRGLWHKCQSQVFETNPAWRKREHKHARSAMSCFECFSITTAHSLGSLGLCHLRKEAKLFGKLQAKALALPPLNQETCIWNEEPENAWCLRHASRFWDSMKMQVEVAENLWCLWARPTTSSSPQALTSWNQRMRCHPWSQVHQSTPSHLRISSKNVTSKFGSHTSCLVDSTAYAYMSLMQSQGQYLLAETIKGWLCRDTRLLQRMSLSNPAKSPPSSTL